MNKKPLIILTGPTAVGKTELSINLAKKINGEIISADSIQVYKYMDIGSAKITESEKSGIKHYLIDELNPNESFHIVLFQKLALSYMDEIYARGKIPIIVGGTGFYIQSILYDVDFDESVIDKRYRQELERLAKEKGNSYLHEMLSEVDQEAAIKIHENNVKRIIRALEFYKETGLKISEHNKEQSEKKSPYNFIYFVLNDKREDIYARINKRVDQMIEKGLVDEVKGLIEKGYTRDLVSMQGLGYKEITSYLEGDLSLEEAIYILKRDTRHFAKRQITWFKREKDVTWINRWEYDDEDSILSYMISKIKESIG